MKRAQDAAAVAALSAGWLLVFLYIDPRGQFPLNDDFQYAEVVRRWAQGAGPSLSPWALSTSLTHLALGRLAAFFMTPDNWHLRLLMLSLGLATGLLFYSFLRYLRLQPLEAAAGTATLVICPIYMTMSASFHLDITSAALQIAACWAFIAALRSRSLVWLAACSALLGLGLLTRQTAAFSALGACAVLWRRRILNLPALAALLLPSGLAAAGFWLWLHAMPELPWAWRTQLPSPALSLGHAALAFNASSQTAALLIFPLALGLFRLELWRKPRRAAALAVAAVSSLAVVCWLHGERMPLLGNTLSTRGLGVLTLTAPEAKAAWLWSSRWVWLAADALGLLCAAQLCLSLPRSRAAADASSETSALLWFGLPPYAVMVFFSLNFDRYLLTVLPFLIAALLLIKEKPLRPRLWALGLCVALLSSAAGLKDYFSWNRARWEAGQSLVRLGVAPEQIENGFDWDGQFTLDRNLAKLLREKPAAEIGMWDWMKENKVVAITSFSDKTPKEGFKPLAKFPYATPLSLEPAFVYLYGDARAFTARR